MSSVSERALGYADVIRGAFRGFGVLLVGGLVEPFFLQVAGVVGYAWLPLTAVAAFGTAAVTATPRGTSLGAWRQAPVAAVASYALILPLVRVGSGELPPVQLALTTLTALVIGSLVGLLHIQFDSTREARTSAGVAQGAVETSPAEDADGRCPAAGLDRRSVA